MRKTIFCCAVLEKELKYFIEETGIEDVDLQLLDAALHVDLDRLASAVGEALAKGGGKGLLVMGRRCHPDLEVIASKHETAVVQADNCIDMLLGEKKWSWKTGRKHFTLPGDG